jgi:hypothetical protein
MDQANDKWKKWGQIASPAIQETGLQGSQDPTMQSIGDVASFTAAGAQMGGPAGAAIGAGIGVVKSAINFNNARKARREARRAKERQDRRLNMLRKSELNMREREMRAEREGRAFSRRQAIEDDRRAQADKMMGNFNSMLRDNADLRRSLIEQGYI